MGHINVRELMDGYMRKQYTGYTIPRQMLGQRARLSLPKCDSCGKCKQRRTTFRPARVEGRPERYAGHTMCVDIHCFVNCTAEDGTMYRANFTDPVSKATLSYGMVTKPQLMACCELVLSEYHHRYQLGAWKIIHSDQEAVLSSTEATV